METTIFPQYARTLTPQQLAVETKELKNTLLDHYLEELGFDLKKVAGCVRELAQVALDEAMESYRANADISLNLYLKCWIKTALYKII